MKKILLSALISLAGLTSFAQTITNPLVGNSDDPYTTVSSVETNKQFTIVTLEYTAAGENAWAQLNKEIYLQTDLDNRHYNYIKSEDIPLAPAKHIFSKEGDKLTFRIYFEKIPATAKSINIIERAGGSNNGSTFFNFYNVSLEKSRGDVMTGRVIVDSVMVPPVPNGGGRLSFSDNNMAGMLGAMGPVFGNMARSIMDAQLDYYKQPGKITEVAKLTKQYFDALVKEGFSYEQAIKIITSDALLPKAIMGGK
ncbi:hypothetical protein [Mucilaginibacter sp. UR6-11]|uniref:hypothetical protein n=1 Tax=Mucilaginibacter sp. UR6-11 TaxID=1435644 RepID=UPI001E2B5A82|nr:hypothetical protein [Mucilaginibacter sp. UR6-11]MCC8426987.1 hypothetical protein [Mucilaginibacter sp. UR6-11]